MCYSSPIDRKSDMRLFERQRCVVMYIQTRTCIATVLIRFIIHHKQIRRLEMDTHGKRYVVSLSFSCLISS